ncbi:F0F1 ATP synthase subunit delta [Streptococcus macacae]|uniref:ATP synthase subunit delta n=1 Tax=Streptococcus macacae NCTC 11558 TaxID=764298 RepID=G5JWJ1_9STRE|nr:F0F1 ATP synthase subunit delta [Streptococcus macacae]EHJ53326.1 ATP synthase F1, delta subunit [Streptococcus macacae NCTC 11558]SUN78771.1 F-type H+-transporting ATPase subunit delta [Streptococcus macacae NCTC 11558]
MDKKTQALIEQYAKSLVEVAVEHKETKTIQEEVNSILEVFDGTVLAATLAHDGIYHSDKSKLVRLFQDSCSPYMNNFLEIILQNERENYLYAILKTAADLFAHTTESYDISVTSAVALTDSQKTRILEMAKKKFNIRDGKLVEKIDETIIGGFIINVNNRVIDTSIRHQLQQLKLKLK